MSPRTKEQFEKIRESTSTRILDAALELFAVNGFHATSISQIAEKAGISKGLMYNYFENKDDLLRKIIEDGFRQLEVMMGGIYSETDPRKALEKVIHVSMDHIRNNPTYWRLYMSVILQSESQKEVEELMMDFRDKATQELSELFKAMGEKDHYLKGYTLGTQLDGIGFNMVTAPDSFPLDELENYLIETYCSPRKKKRKAK
jgi:AcrR family transcriptional regulator